MKTTDELIKMAEEIAQERYEGKYVIEKKGELNYEGHFGAIKLSLTDLDIGETIKAGSIRQLLMSMIYSEWVKEFHEKKYNKGSGVTEISQETIDNIPLSYSPF